MISSRFRTDSQTMMVVDASVVINLNATGYAPEIIRAFPNQVVVTDSAIAELASGVRNGHGDAQKLQELIDSGVVQAVTVGETCIHIYESLIDGNALSTLDDGEAATIAYAYEVHGIAMIDERKARRLCAERFPDLPVFLTVDLLLHDLTVQALGRTEQIESIYRALSIARMRVPPERMALVVQIIGDERAKVCSSLPKLARFAC